MTDTVKKSNPLKKLLLIALALDVVWAILIATFGSTILNQVGTGFGADQVATGTVTVLGWIITFVIAFFQGAIFMCVLGVFAIVLIALFGKKSAKS